MTESKYADAIIVLQNAIKTHAKECERPHELSYPIATPEHLAYCHKMVKENFEEAISVLEKAG